MQLGAIIIADARECDTIANFDVLFSQNRLLNKVTDSTPLPRAATILLNRDNILPPANTRLKATIRLPSMAATTAKLLRRDSTLLKVISKLPTANLLLHNSPTELLRLDSTGILLQHRHPANTVPLLLLTEATTERRRFPLRRQPSDTEHLSIFNGMARVMRMRSEVP